VSPSDVGLPPAVPEVVPHVVTLTPCADTRTLLVVEESGYRPGPVLEMSRQGQEQCLEKLAAAVEER
jgi:hypothetical protein